MTPRVGSGASCSGVGECWGLRILSGSNTIGGGLCHIGSSEVAGVFGVQLYCVIEGWIDLKAIVEFDNEPILRV